MGFSWHPFSKANIWQIHFEMSGVTELFMLKRKIPKGVRKFENLNYSRFSSLRYLPFLFVIFSEWRATKKTHSQRYRSLAPTDFSCEWPSCTLDSFDFPKVVTPLPFQLEDSFHYSKVSIHQKFVPLLPEIFYFLRISILREFQLLGNWNY